MKILAAPHVQNAIQSLREETGCSLVAAHEAIYQYVLKVNTPTLREQMAMAALANPGIMSTTTSSAAEKALGIADKLLALTRGEP